MRLCIVCAWLTLRLQLLIRDLEQSVRLLTDQVKHLSLSGPSTSSYIPVQRSSPSPSTTGSLTQLLRHQTMGPTNQQPPPSYQPMHGPYPPPQQSQPPLHGPWFTSNIAAPQASHPTAPPPIPNQPMLRTPPQNPSEEWDEMYLQVLQNPDNRQLRELLARTSPDAVMPLNGPGPLSQAVILTLVHRVCYLMR